MLTLNPSFPVFKTLQIDDMPVVSQFVGQFPVYSDFNFVSMFTWGVNDTTQYSFLNGNLIIKLRDYNTGEDSYSIIGITSVSNTVQQLIEQFGLPSIDRVPQITVDALRAERTENKFHVDEQRDEHDYVYGLKELVALEGPTYRKLRRSLSNFSTKNEISPELKKIAFDDEVAKTQILDLTKRWRKIRQRTYQDASAEYFAIRKTLRHFEKLPVDVWGLYDKNTLLGFVITEDIDSCTLLHFEKADTELSGLGTVLKHEVCSALSAAGQKTLNYEQDLGVPGLREAKMSLSPVDFMKKYNVSVVRAD